MVWEVLVGIGPGKGLLPGGTKPSPEAIMPDGNLTNKAQDINDFRYFF